MHEERFDATSVFTIGDVIPQSQVSRGNEAAEGLQQQMQTLTISEQRITQQYFQLNSNQFP